MEKTLTRTWELGGASLHAEISPCSWMYPSYGLQIKVTIKDGGAAYLRNADVIWAQARKSDFDALTERVAILPCPRCSRPAFDPKAVDTNRAGLCEDCFLADLNLEFAAAQAEEAQKVAEQDAEQVRSGSTHRVTAWVHPPQGDDYQLDIYFKGEPKPAEIHAELRKRRSRVLDDYQIVELTASKPSDPPDSGKA